MSLLKQRAKSLNLGCGSNLGILDKGHVAIGVLGLSSLGVVGSGTIDVCLHLLTTVGDFPYQQLTFTEALQEASVTISKGQLRREEHFVPV